MKPFSSVRPPGIIEPLESRIAPANVYVVNVPNQDDYTNPKFPFIASGSAMDQISDAVGGDSHSFYIKLSTGDKINIYNTTNGSQQTFLSVTSGNMVAFFEDNGDLQVQASELSGISIGKNVSFVLNGSLVGDVVANLNDQGGIQNATILMDSLVSASQGIKSIQANGVSGHIIAGGNINKLTISNAVGSVLGGTAANGVSVNFFNNVPGSKTGIIDFSEPAKHKGSSISNVIVGSIDLIQAGDGGFNAAGGSINKVQITQDPTDFSLIAGSGGQSTSKGAAGAGGSITTVYVSGIPPLLTSTTNAIGLFHAGDGGDGGSLGNGGKGGSISGLHIGYQLVAGKTTLTADPLNDNISLLAGDGGDGKIGGAGGTVTNNVVRVAAPPQPAQGQTPAIDQIVVHGGDGGAGLVKSGAGGSLSNLELLDISLINPDLTIGSRVSVLAGDGGVPSSANGAGGNGGSITKISVFGTIFDIEAGDGSSGTSGGHGGSLTSIELLSESGQYSNTGILNAGKGGDGTTKTAGNGGNINSSTIKQSDFNSLIINGGTAADGGTSLTGKGGRGGSISKFLLNDTDSKVSFAGDLLVRAGDAGDGGKGGGVGGSITTATFNVFNMSADISSGDGGNTLGTKGSGGGGGSLKAISFTTKGAKDFFPVTTVFRSGAGGNGEGSGSGGAGGSISTLNAEILQPVAMASPLSDLSIIAGDGGNGGTGAPGKGGSIVSTGGFNALGSSLMQAGDAGLDGGKAAAGGQIVGQSKSKVSGLYALNNLTVMAGNGSLGGAGGSIRFFGYGSPSSDLEPTPGGNILIQAGNGSNGNTAAGVGGSIAFVSGSVSSGTFDPFSSLSLKTQIVAGTGGASATKSANGGSVSNLIIQLGGNYNSELQIDAGDAGSFTASADSIKKGGAGGSVKDVSISDLDPLTIIRHVAAGGGGQASSGTGGAGGSVTNLFVSDLDIGVREGQVYGYNTMGGIFAGVGGDGVKAGKAGDVIGVTASAISAIVAGRGAVPQLAGLVESIYIGTSATTGEPATNLLKDSTHDLNLSPGATTGKWHAFQFKDPTLFVGDIEPLYLTSLVNDVLDPSNPVSNYLVSLMTFAEESLLSSNATPKAVKMEVLTNVLDRAIDGGESIYTAQRFAGEFLSPDTEIILAQDPMGADSAYLNRLLLQDTYYQLPTLAFKYRVDNLVGAVVDPLAKGANQFQYIANGSAHAEFQLGDTPIDGLIMALKLNQKKINFTPEASLIGNVFYDYDNLV